MKRLIKSAGFVALGALALPTAQAEDGKPWNVSASLHGFYDDNYSTLPSSGVPAPAPAPAGTMIKKRSSVGFRLSPSASYDSQSALGPTRFQAGYTYKMTYFEDRKNNSADHSHDATVRLSHDLPDQFRLSLSDNFVVAQEPGVLDPVTVTAPTRSNGNNLRNTVNLTGSADLNRELSVEGGYSNNYYDYQEKGVGSRSALLDRTEHLANVAGRYRILENTLALLGYQFGLTRQNSSDALDAAGTSARIRDSRSHYAYAGIDTRVVPEWTVSARAGVQYTTYPNSPVGARRSGTSPYVDINSTYEINKESSFMLGIKHSHNQTDIADALDAETTTVYGSLDYQFLPELKATLLAQYQHSTFNQGTANDKADNFFLADLKLSYEIFKDRLSTEAGYQYYRLDSDLPFRSFYRNIIYIGLKASY
jgi:hypothetical protein